MTGGKQPRAKGKSTEAWVASNLKGKRAGYGNASSMPDVTSDFVGAEVKRVQKLPVFLEDAFSTVKSRCPDKLLPIVVIKIPRGEARVYMDFKDFCEWFV